MPVTPAIPGMNKNVQAFVKKIILYSKILKLTFWNLRALFPVVHKLRHQHAVALKIYGFPVAVKFKGLSNHKNVDPYKQGDRIGD